ncbi:hypothetical protein [Kitasatospora sp. DSM 101779]|uniref:hypothetical protein n=1 Tax=Kitasatospora sp. DSM 101779 TaxID=2853165 RepID=UPI0021D9B2E2|nr:hypothetical protein [Kitasatospora sp. DSM 101779]MCU7820274.1 hypothetical protein [Kitasatospora sp. DSM 101779]
MTDWATISSLATAGGTLVLAVATFASVRSANRSARTAERTLLAGQQPLLVTSREQDPELTARFVEGRIVTVPGGGAVVEVHQDIVQLAISLRNVGTGLAVLQSWHVTPEVRTERAHPPLAEFTAHVRDIFLAPGDHGCWQGAFRDPSAAEFRAMTAAIDAGKLLTVDVLYSDYEGGQRVISQFALRHDPAEQAWKPSVIRHFPLDRPEPR